MWKTPTSSRRPPPRARTAHCIISEHSGLLLVVCRSALLVFPRQVDTELELNNELVMKLINTISEGLADYLVSSVQPTSHMEARTAFTTPDILTGKNNWVRVVCTTVDILIYTGLFRWYFGFLSIFMRIWHCHFELFGYITVSKENHDKQVRSTRFVVNSRLQHRYKRRH